MQPKSPAG